MVKRSNDNFIRFEFFYLSISLLTYSELVLQVDLINEKRLNIPVSEAEVEKSIVGEQLTENPK